MKLHFPRKNVFRRKWYALNFYEAYIKFFRFSVLWLRVVILFANFIVTRTVSSTCLYCLLDTIITNCCKWLLILKPLPRYQVNSRYQGIVFIICNAQSSIHLNSIHLNSFPDITSSRCMMTWNITCYYVPFLVRHNSHCVATLEVIWYTICSMDYIISVSY